MNGALDSGIYNVLAVEEFNLRLELESGTECCLYRNEYTGGNRAPYTRVHEMQCVQKLVHGQE